MIERITKLAKAIVYIASAIVAVLYCKWFWDFVGGTKLFKKKEEETDENVED